MVVEPDAVKDVDSRRDGGVRHSGFWVLEQQLQKNAEASSSPWFGGPQSVDLDSFLVSHEDVVYIGWGSMFVRSTEFMAAFAVQALKMAGRNGIVLGSYSDIGKDALLDPDLKAYASEHVLFLKWAPHEWLMPRCAVVVHHGGCGTTAASLRAGKPTVVTPVAFDQFYWAERVCQMGVGTSTEQLANATPDALVEALARCD